MKKKTEGGGFMVSGFRSSGGGWLTLTGAEKAGLEQGQGIKLKYFYQWKSADGGDDLYYSYHNISTMSRSGGKGKVVAIWM